MWFKPQFKPIAVLGGPPDVFSFSGSKSPFSPLYLSSDQLPKRPRWESSVTAERYFPRAPLSAGTLIVSLGPVAVTAWRMARWCEITTRSPRASQKRLHPAPGGGQGSDLLLKSCNHGSLNLKGSLLAGFLLRCLRVLSPSWLWVNWKVVIVDCSRS